MPSPPRAANRPPPPLAAIVGPTASGKTDLSLALAERLPIEILVADSRQVYRGMDIGTAKPDAAARAAVPHHLLDLVDPDAAFTVADWVDRARQLVPEIWARGRLPVVVGGTGLYVSALVDGYRLAAQPPRRAAPRAGRRDGAGRPGGPGRTARPAGPGNRGPHRPAQPAARAARPRNASSWPAGPLDSRAPNRGRAGWP